MKKIGDLLQFHIGTLYQKTGLKSDLRKITNVQKPKNAQKHNVSDPLSERSAMS